MVKQVMISCYLLFFSLAFKVFKLFPKSNVTVFVASYGDNILFTVKELERQNVDQKIVVLETKKCQTPFYDYPSRTILKFDYLHPYQWLKSVYHLATCEYIFVDNYYHFLSVTDFAPNVKCIQLWHGAGAIKNIALQSKQVKSLPKQALNRIKRVYNRFDHMIVGSEQMSNLFQTSFGLNKDKMLTTGIPRTDFFFDHDEINYVKHLIYMEFPIFKQKKVIIYAPTYREYNEKNKEAIHMNISKMYDELKHDYVLLLKLHPSLNEGFENKHPGFAFNMSYYPNINHLLVISDLLITDYTSIPFEYALLNKPIIFYAYDLEKYSKLHGLVQTYEQSIPGPIAQDTDELIEQIKEYQFDFKKIENFALTWNEYSFGTSSKNLIKAIYGVDDKDIVEKVSVLDTATAESVTVSNKLQESIDIDQ